MTTSVKPIVPSAFVFFHKKVFESFRDVGIVKLRRVKSCLKYAANLTKNKYRECREKTDVRKLLKALVKSILTKAENIAAYGRVDSTKLLEELFGSPVVHFDERFEKPYDVVVVKDMEKMDVWICQAPGSNEDDLNSPIVASLTAERDFEKNCEQVRVFRAGEEEVVQLTEELRKQATSRIIENKGNCNTKNRSNLSSRAHPSDEETPKFQFRNAISQEKNDQAYTHNIRSEDTSSKTEEKATIKFPNSKKDANSEIEYIGVFDLKEKHPFTRSCKKNELNGFLDANYASIVQPLDFIVVEENEKEPFRVYCRVNEIKGYNKYAATRTKSINEFIVPITLEPSYECDKSYSGVPRVNDLDGYRIRTPTNEELSEVLRLPKEGVPLGYVTGTRPSHLLFLYPTTPSDTIYQSMIITGTQRSGKTNFLKMLVRAFSTHKGLDPSNRPSIVILDGERDFISFPPTNRLKPEAKAFLKQKLIGDPEVEVIKISQTTSSDYTLSLSGMNPQDLTYLVPELPTKTVEVGRNHKKNKSGNEK